MKHTSEVMEQALTQAGWVRVAEGPHRGCWWHATYGGNGFLTTPLAYGVMCMRQGRGRR